MFYFVDFHVSSLINYSIEVITLKTFCYFVFDNFFFARPKKKQKGRPSSAREADFPQNIFRVVRYFVANDVLQYHNLGCELEKCGKSTALIVVCGRFGYGLL